MPGDKKVGLALSGGAVLGFAHLGVIKVLQEHHIPIHCVAGTSAGSLVGAFLAAGFTFEQMWKLGQNLSWGKIGGPIFPTKGLLNSKLLERFVDQNIGVKDISELHIPFAAVAMDLTTGRELVIDQGPIGEAVRASCAIPGVFTPLEKNEAVLVDGGLVNFLPVETVRRMGADYVIAVKLVPSPHPSKKPENIFQILFYSFEYMVRELAKRAPEGDVTITPNLVGLNSRDFHQKDILVQRGIEAAEAALPKILRDLKITPQPPWWKRLLKVLHS